MEITVKYLTFSAVVAVHSIFNYALDKVNEKGGRRVVKNNSRFERYGDQQDLRNLNFKWNLSGFMAILTYNK